MTLGSRGSAQGWALGLGEGAPAFSGRSGARLLCPSQDFSPTPGLEVETEQPSPLSADPGSGCPGGGTGLPAVPWAQGYGGEREGTSGPAGRWAGLRKGLGRVRVSRALGAALGARDREEPAQPGGQTPTPHPRSIPSWSPNPQPPHIAHSLLSPAKPPSVAMATGAEKAGGAGCFPLFPAPSAGRGLRAGRRLQPPPASEPPPPRQAWPQPAAPSHVPRGGQAKRPLHCSLRGPSPATPGCRPRPGPCPALGHGCWPSCRSRLPWSARGHHGHLGLREADTMRPLPPPGPGLGEQPRVQRPPPWGQQAGGRTCPRQGPALGSPFPCVLSPGLPPTRNPLSQWPPVAAAALHPTEGCAWTRPRDAAASSPLRPALRPLGTVPIRSLPSRACHTHTPPLGTQAAATQSAPRPEGDRQVTGSGLSAQKGL